MAQKTIIDWWSNQRRWSYVIWSPKRTALCSGLVRRTFAERSSNPRLTFS